MELLDCGHPESEHSAITRGYGKTAEGKKHCYECCAKQDRESMLRLGKTCLYLTIDTEVNSHGSNQWVHGDHKLTNWPGSFEIKIKCLKKGNHNIAGNRYDLWFEFEGGQWWGVQYGDNTQIAHCKRLKQ